VLFACAVILPGCGGTTREDRSITFSAGGGQVGFQHGREGVFVADKEGGGLTKIFAPDKDTIAVGTPLWAPNDRRLIFTTARAQEKADGSPVVRGTEEDPAGRLFLRQPVAYTCWLRDEPAGGRAPEPRELFTAQADDVGYVAAGLAVRWHPRGDRVLYVNRVNEGHAVFEFDLATRESRQVFPDAGGAGGVVFDWTPDGSHLVCLLADTPGQTGTASGSAATAPTGGTSPSRPRSPARSASRSSDSRRAGRPGPPTASASPSSPCYSGRIRPTQPVTSSGRRPSKGAGSGSCVRRRSRSTTSPGAPTAGASASSPAGTPARCGWRTRRAAP